MLYRLRFGAGILFRLQRAVEQVISVDKVLLYYKRNTSLSRRRVIGRIFCFGGNGLLTPYVLTKEVALLSGDISKTEFAAREATMRNQGLFIYGVSENFKIFYCEDLNGQLFEIPFQTE